MRLFKNILIIAAVLSLISGCTLMEGSHADENVYIPPSDAAPAAATTQPQIRTRHSVDLPTDMNKANVQDYYEVPSVVKHKSEPKPEKELTPPKI